MAGAIVLPGANYRQLPGKSRIALDVRWITVHTMAGTLEGTESWFTPPGRPYSHRGLGGDGEVRQWQDGRYRAASDLEANPYSLSWECEDRGPGFPDWDIDDAGQVPAFTDAQVKALIVGLSWDCHRFGLPRTAIRSTCRHERGIGWHRLGIDPWRRAGCLLTSRHRGKRCPGDRRIYQLVNDIIPRVSAPGGVPQEDDDMPSAQEVADGIAKELLRGGSDLRRNAAKFLNDELDKRQWGLRPLLVQAERGGRVYVLEGDRGGKWLVRGWDNVRALVAFYGVHADGMEDGHPKPWPIPQTVLDAIPESAPPTTVAPGGLSDLPEG